MNKIQPVRGTQDLLHLSMQYHDYIIDHAKGVAKQYCYQQLNTPILEKSEIFHRSLGVTSDILNKETYTFIDRDKTSITLRPEFTASVVRAAVSNSMIQQLPLKLFSYGPLFRHERPQKYRYRQFHQVNFEYLGATSHHCDAEIITMASGLLHNIGLDKYIKLELNSLGDKFSRQEYSLGLVEYFSKYKQDLSEDSKIRLTKNPLRILDSKDEQDKKIVADAPKMSDYYNYESQQYFTQLQQLLSDMQISFVINDKLVRGLDYYTHTVFEYTTELLGSQGTVLAGGRYDGLMEAMGGGNIAGIGFGAGIERLAALYQANNQIIDQITDIYILPVTDDLISYAMQLTTKLRQNDFKVWLDYTGNMKKRMKKANSLQANYVIIIGPDELQKNVFTIKNMQDSSEQQVETNNIIKFLKQRG